MFVRKLLSRGSFTIVAQHDQSLPKADLYAPCLQNFICSLAPYIKEVLSLDDISHLVLKENALVLFEALNIYCPLPFVISSEFAYS